LETRPWKCGGSEEAGEGGGESKIHEADKRRVWTVAGAASVSGVRVIHMYCTYMGESFPEVLHGLVKPGGGRREVSHWLLNDALKHEMH
jgi:hypothetical protein